MQTTLSFKPKAEAPKVKQTKLLHDLDEESEHTDIMIDSSDDSESVQEQPAPASKPLTLKKFDDTSAKRPVSTSKSGIKAVAGSKAMSQFTGKPSSIGYTDNPIPEPDWKPGAPVPFLALANTLERLEQTTKRLEHIHMMCDFFRTVITRTPSDLTSCVYLCSNMIFEPYKGIELGVGDGIISQALQDSTGKKLDEIKRLVHEYGDLGLVAERCRNTQRTLFPPPPLTCDHVFKKFREIAQMSGNKSTDQKKKLINSLYSSCKQCETRFITRMLQGALRANLGIKTVLSALANACVCTPPDGKIVAPFSLEDAQTRMERAWSETSSFERMIAALTKGGFEALDTDCIITPGIPIIAMLAKPTKSVTDALQKVSGQTATECTCEYKYDGQRAQFHFPGGNKPPSIYSRNSEDLTGRFPDALQYVMNGRKFPEKSFILDSEIVAVDPSTKEILPFQILTQRPRKDVKIESIKVPVCVFAFDMLFFDGRSLLNCTLRERRQILRDNFAETQNTFRYAIGEDLSDEDEIAALLDRSVKDKCEGLMVKSLDSVYESGRSSSWAKLKKDYMDTTGDTVDLVPIGGYIGKGKRTGVYGGFLMACYDQEDGEYQTVCKVGTGFSEADLEKFSKALTDLSIGEDELKRMNPRFKFAFSEDPRVKPDVWFEPKLVWELKGADYSVSPLHKSARQFTHTGEGISLRFPRFMRDRSDEKGPRDASSSEFIRDLYESQANKQGAMKARKKMSTEDDSDFGI
ncbi:putative DNA ligase 1 [Blattamonas nauphoetae]|uniref:DNA ligase n=1 Tax=Blattamonas nauphoetae TaxID=2049346 RepID=A0ABQ9YEJ6_9EUKA|nr:putative DNA ligase 1 [Blattamonas nauphoetae]